jgi:MoxR-like ATPase
MPAIPCARSHWRLQYPKFANNVQDARDVDTHFSDRIPTIESVQNGLASTGYIPSRQISTAVFLAMRLGKPILAEGPAGVGKTELAKAAAEFLGLPLVRMQCYDGLDESKALYEWKYGKQLLYTQILKEKVSAVLSKDDTMDAALQRLHEFDDIFFSERFLEPRPLLKALQEPKGAVLLIDEIDKADEEFEAFLLEILSDHQVTIPEIGTISAIVKPVVILTSNNTRDLGDAMKRRCLHLHIGYPDAKLEEQIIDSRIPGIEESLRRQLVSFVQQLRGLDLRKLPSVSETIDWARAILLLNATRLGTEVVHDTLNLLLKFEGDMTMGGKAVGEMVHKALRDGGIEG